MNSESLLVISLLVQYVLYHDCQLTTQSLCIYLAGRTKIWVYAVFPHFLVYIIR
jgi:hypothetical protein